MILRFRFEFDKTMMLDFERKFDNYLILSKYFSWNFPFLFYFQWTSDLNPILNEWSRLDLSESWTNQTYFGVNFRFRSDFEWSSSIKTWSKLQFKWVFLSELPVRLNELIHFQFMVVVAVSGGIKGHIFFFFLFLKLDMFVIVVVLLFLKCVNVIECECRFEFCDCARMEIIR